jgi:hypothetical protein
MWSGSIRVIISHLHSNLKDQPFYGWTQNQCFRDLLACFCHHSWNNEPDQGESKSPKLVLSATTLTLTMESSLWKQDLRLCRHYKHSKHQYLFTNCHNVTSQKIWIKLPEHWFLAQLYQTCFKEMVQFSQTMGFNSNLPKGIVQADMHAFIHHKCFKSHHKCFKSHMDYLPYITKEVHNIHVPSLTTISKIMEKPVQITWWHKAHTH